MPSIDGDIIAFSSNLNNNGDIFYYRISTGQTIQATTSLDNYDIYPVVSGEFIAFERVVNNNRDIWLYSIPLNSEEPATYDPAQQYLHDLSGNRLVFTDDRNGNMDIYLFEFVFDDPQIGAEGCDDPMAINLFGPKVYTRGHGKPCYVHDVFAGFNMAGNAYICIQNGDEDGDNRVTSAKIKLNHDQVAKSDDFNPNVESLEIPVEVRDLNSLAVQLRGKPHSTFTLRVVQVPDDDLVIITCSSFEPKFWSTRTIFVFSVLLLLPFAFIRLFRTRKPKRP